MLSGVLVKPVAILSLIPSAQGLCLIGEPLVCAVVLQLVFPHGVALLLPPPDQSHCLCMCSHPFLYTFDPRVGL